jgi:small membrane protein
MRPIQYILICLLGVGFVCYLKIFRSKLFDRMIFLMLFVLGTFFVLLPDTTTELANQLGVSRGADLVTYLAWCMFGYLWLMLYTKLRGLERQNTELVRALAIESALQREKSNAPFPIKHPRKTG